jgi:hypothetical protein
MSLSDQLKSIAVQGAINAGATPSPEMKDLIGKHAVADMELEIAEKSLQRSLNGDPQGALIDSLTVKLQFAAQDPTVLAEITEAEIHMLEMEVKAAKEAKIFVEEALKNAPF